MTCLSVSLLEELFKEWVVRLKHRTNRSLEVLKCVGENVYLIALPAESEVNVSDISPYHVENNNSDSTIGSSKLRKHGKSLFGCLEKLHDNLELQLIL